MTVYNKLKYLFSLEKRSNAGPDDNIRFCTEADFDNFSVPMSSAQKERMVLLLQLKTLSVSPFSLPFGKNGRVREALAMSFRPLLGNEDDSILMIPQIIEQSSDMTAGAVWFVSKTEIEEIETQTGDGITFWPASLAFASEIKGHGLVICNSEKGTSGTLFNNGTPLLYRWTPSSEGSVNELEKWFAEYSRSIDIPVYNVKIVESSAISAGNIQRAGQETLRSLKGLASLDLSTKSADSVRKMESFYATAYSTVRAALFLGLFFLLLSAGTLLYSVLKKDAFEKTPFEIYQIAFGESSNHPLAASAAKIKNQSINGTNMSLEQTISNLAAAWKTSVSSDSVRLDTIRYGTERTEIQGTASKTESIESLRDSLSKNGFTSAIIDIQQISGSGMRFSIGLESPERKGQK